MSSKLISSFIVSINCFPFAGGLEAFEEKLRLEEEEREAAKRREEERRKEISKKTRSRLSELLDRKRAEVLLELERYVNLFLYQGPLNFSIWFLS